MRDIVIDASVVVKWYIPERNHEQALALRDDYLAGHHSLCAPTLLPYEVINALKYSGQYHSDRLHEAARTLPEYGIDLIPYQDAGPIAQVATTTDCPVYDAAYLAIADTIDAPVYTADTALLERLSSTRFADTAIHIRTYPD